MHINQRVYPLRKENLLAKFALIAMLTFSLLPISGAFARPAPDGFADLVEEVMPAIVNISTRQVIENSGSSRRGFDPFREFFGDSFPFPELDQSPREANALGSGFFISDDGYIITNNHVIDGADEITIINQDGDEYEAEVIGLDPQTDIALLKVDVNDHAYIEFGDNTKSRVGDWVVAIGNPFGFGGTVTAGIISASGRDINAGPYDDFIQIDASINRGNSGGPLFNLEGKVIGVNTAIISPNGGSIGIGFAVPSSTVEPVIEQLKEYGKVRRGWLGVQIQSVDEELSSALGLDGAKGALVSDLLEGPAEAAGVERGDVIIRFNGEEIKNSTELPRIVARAKVGSKAKLTVLRDGKEVELNVILEERKDDVDNVVSRQSKPSDEGAILNNTGLTVQELSDDIRQRYGIPKDISGVVVIKVEPLSPASRQQITPGTVLREVNNQEVKSPADVAEQILIAQEKDRKSISAFVYQAGSNRYLALPIEAEEISGNTEE